MRITRGKRLLRRVPMRCSTPKVIWVGNDRAQSRTLDQYSAKSRLTYQFSPAFNIQDYAPRRRTRRRIRAKAWSRENDWQRFVKTTTVNRNSPRLPHARYTQLRPLRPREVDSPAPEPRRQQAPPVQEIGLHLRKLLAPEETKPAHEW